MVFSLGSQMRERYARERARPCPVVAAGYSIVISRVTVMGLPWSSDLPMTRTTAVPCPENRTIASCVKR